MTQAPATAMDKEINAIGRCRSVTWGGAPSSTMLVPEVSYDAQLWASSNAALKLGNTLT